MAILNIVRFCLTTPIKFNSLGANEIIQTTITRFILYPDAHHSESLRAYIYQVSEKYENGSDSTISRPTSATTQLRKSRL